MHAFLISLVTIATAEMGDKTQLLAFILATRFKKPIPIIGGIIVATVLNHTIAAVIGEWIGKSLSDTMIHWVLFFSFTLAAIWILIPDKLDKEAANKVTYSSSVFITPTIAFFLAEIGDKTQIATAILAAKFQILLPVIMGTTTGMLVADIPAVILGHKAAQYFPVKIIKIIAAVIFLILGVMELLKVV